MLNLKVVFEIHSSCQNENSMETNQWTSSATPELQIKWKTSNLHQILLNVGEIVSHNLKIHRLSKFSVISFNTNFCPAFDSNVTHNIINSASEVTENSDRNKK